MFVFLKIGLNLCKELVNLFVLEFIKCMILSILGFGLFFIMCLMFRNSFSLDFSRFMLIS